MLLVLSLTFLPSARGITNVPCPTFRIVCLGAEKCEGANIKLKTELSGAGPRVTPTYKWCVSAGTITSGQDTNSIEIDASHVSDEWITVVVMIGGLDRACLNHDTYKVRSANVPLD